MVSNVIGPWGSVPDATEWQIIRRNRQEMRETAAGREEMPWHHSHCDRRRPVVAMPVMPWFGAR